MTERPVPEGWEQRDRLIPIGAPELVAAQILTEAVQRIADKIDGLDSEDKDPARQKAYEDFCFAYDRAAWKPRGADDLSACVIVIFALLDCLGYESPPTDTGYEPRMGRAVIELCALGVALNKWLAEMGRPPAWHDAKVPGCPLPAGPYAALVGNNGSEGAEHGFVGLDGLDADGRGPVVEGGQASQVANGYRIAKGTYAFETRAPGKVWARRVDPNPRPARRLRGWLDLAAIPLTQRATLPEGA